MLIRATKRGKKRMKRNKVVRGGFEPLFLASLSLSLFLSLFHAHSVHVYVLSYIRKQCNNTRARNYARHTRDPSKLPFSLFTYFWPIQFSHSLSLFRVSVLRLLSTLAFLSPTLVTLIHSLATFHPFARSISCRLLLDSKVVDDLDIFDKPTFSSYL